MTPEFLTGLGSGALLVVAAMWFGIAAATVILPFVLVSAARSLRGIQRELERLNGGAIAADVRARAAADAVREHARGGDLGHQLLR